MRISLVRLSGVRIRRDAIVPRFVKTLLLDGIKQTTLEKILPRVRIERLMDAEEVATLVAAFYQGKALTGVVYHIYRGLLLASGG